MVPASRRAFLASIAGAAATLAGCTGGDGAGSTPPRTGTPTDTPTGTPSPTRTPGRTLTAAAVSPDDLPDGAALTTVSPSMARFVATAIERGVADAAVDVPRLAIDEAAARGIGALEHVAVGGTYYAVGTRYEFHASRMVSVEGPTSAPDDATVVAVSDLPEAAREAAVTAIETGTYTATSHEAVYDTFGRAEFLKYDGRTYAVSVTATGDADPHAHLELSGVPEGELSDPDAVPTLAVRSFGMGVRSAVWLAIKDGSAPAPIPDAAVDISERFDAVLTAAGLYRLSVA